MTRVQENGFYKQMAQYSDCVQNIINYCETDSDTVQHLNSEFTLLWNNLFSYSSSKNIP